MSGNPEVLIRELLDNVQASGNKVAERRLADLTVWYYKNRERIPPENVIAKCAFLEKSLWISIEMMALLLDRIHELETAGKPKGLWTINGLSVQGDVRKFG